MAPDARDLSAEGLVRELQHLAAELGTSTVARSAWKRRTGISDWLIIKHFDSWNRFVEAAGLTPETYNSRLTDDELFTAMEEAFVGAGRVVPRIHYRKAARYGSDAYVKRWGSWQYALLAFREWLNTSGREFPYLDQLPRDRAALAKVEAIVPTVPPQRGSSEPMVGSRRYGPILNFRGLLHAPVNEQGVVFLFGMIALELGYIVESVQEGYPDCEGKRRVGPDTWERVRIEFEYQSRTFRDHGHDPALCDVIVCWQDNWPESPLPIVELKSAIPGLSTQRHDRPVEDPGGCGTRRDSEVAVSPPRGRPARHAARRHQRRRDRPPALGDRDRKEGLIGGSRG